MNDSRVCVCHETGTMVERCHLHDLPEVDAERRVRELNRECGYPRYWTRSYCPDGDDNAFHYRSVGDLTGSPITDFQPVTRCERGPVVAPNREKQIISGSNRRHPDREEQIMSGRRVCVCYERGAMVEHCHLHGLPEVDAERLVQELNQEYGYPRYWTNTYCPDEGEDDSIFHYRGGH